ncbi:MAG: hypothetical protein LBT00_03235 [Spirochaetaceae bacterium]|jgi:hypothetical protein|nr:hypothetical protein [Spirochaetaceae bacterium]
MNKTFVLALVSCAFLTAGGRDSAEKTVTVSGEVMLVGNVPFVEMIIHDTKERDWFVSGGDRELLNDFVGQEVTVQGIPHETELSLADGSKTFKRYALSRIVIIKPLG